MFIWNQICLNGSDFYYVSSDEEELWFRTLTCRGQRLASQCLLEEEEKESTVRCTLPLLDRGKTSARSEGTAFIGCTLRRIQTLKWDTDPDSSWDRNMSFVLFCCLVFPSCLHKHGFIRNVSERRKFLDDFCQRQTSTNKSSWNIRSIKSRECIYFSSQNRETDQTHMYRVRVHNMMMSLSCKGMTSQSSLWCV